MRRSHARPSATEAGHRVVERPVHHPGAAVVERVDERDLRVDQLEAVAVEAGRREERRDARASGWIAEHTSWRNPGSVELRGAGAAADGVGGLEHEHRAAGLGAR